MANIAISDLNPSEKAPESYLINLSEKELDIQGGLIPLAVVLAIEIIGPTVVGSAIAYGIHAVTH